MEVKITKRNISHYIQFFPEIKLKDIINVDIELHLMKGSNKKVNVKCDICGTERYINYQSYTNNKSSCLKYPIYTCDKCSHIKLKEYNMTHYGVEYYSQHPDRNNKVRKTSLDKYGVEHFSKSDYFFERVSKTNLEKFGFENPFMDKERIKKIFSDKYGVDHPSKVEEFREKIKNTNLERYGSHPMKSDNYRYMKSIISRDRNYLSYYGENTSTFKCDSGHDFKISSDLYHNRIRSNLPLCTICYPLNENVSIKEIELLKFIKSIYGGEIIRSYRDQLEIDIYLPDKKIGFEFNGLYWHNNDQKENDYHINKSKFFEERGIRIVHIWEDDWDYKCDIIKSQISNLIGISNKIYARNCNLVEIDSSKCKLFLDENHIQGNVRSMIRYGLLHKGELVSVMTFDKSEGRKKMGDSEWNINRFCNVKNFSVIGGASKIFKFFLKKNLPSRVISYADKDWSVGDLYYKLGFEKVSDIKQDYKYIIDSKRVHKSRFRKSNLKTNLSESKFMKSIGINKIYDCGKIKFEIIFTDHKS